MKKSVIALIIILALVVFVSPGIVGMLADRAVQEQKDWVAKDADEVIIRSERFDRGWFSSEGTHRISLNESVLSDDERAVIENVFSGPLPDLVIDTRIDHGIVPVASMGREHGSLKPGLGSAVSHLALEFPGGERHELPGAIFSEIGLTGDTLSRYEVGPGSRGDLAWGEAKLSVNVQPDAGRIVFGGRVESLEITAPGDGRSARGMAFDGFVAPTRFGFSTGNVEFSIDQLTVRSPAGPAIPIGPISVVQSSDIVDDKLDGGFRMAITTQAMPGVGKVLVETELKIEGADAGSVGRFVRDLDGMPADASPEQVLEYAGESLMDLCAAGFRLAVEQLDVTLPNGVLAMQIDLGIPETDRADFRWTSLLRTAQLDAHLSIPSPIYDMAAMMNPDIAQAVEMGVLTKTGGVYEMDAVFRKGLLTVNGAPLPIPLSGF